MRIKGDEISIRNNVINVSAGSIRVGINIDPTVTGMTAPDNVWMDNNTIFSSAAAGIIGIDVDGGTNLTARSNITYAPNGTGAYYMYSGTIGAPSGNTNDTANSTTGVSTSPGFAGGTTPSDLADFILNPSSSDYNSGASTPAFPANNSDMYFCYDKDGSKRRGAFVPRSAAICRGGK